MSKDVIVRCRWCLGHALSVEYHDTEWGVPLHDDTKLFEFLVLDAAQAGLNWLMILKKRENYRAAFDNYDAQKIARYREARIQKLLSNPGIVRNQLKVRSAVTNAKAFLKVREERGSFDKYIWEFVDGKPVVSRFAKESQIPAKTKSAEAMSKDMKSRGFAFCGPTICYAFMQAAGLVNDHTVDCFRHAEVGRTR